jgi:sugar lactone lactonase YvrE
MKYSLAIGICVGLSLLFCVAHLHAAKEHRMVVVAGGGDQPAPTRAVDAQLNTPFGVGFDDADNMYLVEYLGGYVDRVTPDGRLTRIAGNGTKADQGDGGPASASAFNGAHMLLVNRAGDVFVADTHNHRIRKIDHRTGVISTVAGSTEGYRGDGGPATEAAFSGIFSISFGATENEIFIADLKNKRIRAVNLTTGLVRLVAGNGQKGVPEDGAVATTSPLVDPRAVTVDPKGNVYILERQGHALRLVTPDGRIRTVAGTGAKGNGDGPALRAAMNGPKHLCIDQDHSVIIADAENNRVCRYDPKTQTLTTLYTHGPPLRGKTEPEPLGRPHAVYVHADGSLYIADSFKNNRVLKVER